MKTALIVIIVLHGLIHMMGFFKAFNLADLKELTQPVARSAGILWLIVSLLFLLTAGFLVAGNKSWWMPGIIALLLSQGLVFLWWRDARFGTVANVILILPLAAGFMDSLPDSYRNIYKRESVKLYLSEQKKKVLTEKDIRHLPEPVQRYLRFTGSLGRPRIENFSVEFTGRMKMKPGADWIEVSTRQLNHMKERTRLFYIESALFGIPFEGLHVYKKAVASMQIKIAALKEIAHARGNEMNRSETVTFFNDLCLLAPGALTEKSIGWKLIDKNRVEARFTTVETTITAELHFSQDGKLINFTSDDRYMSMDGKSYHKYTWSTPVKSYFEKDGRRLVAHAVAVWHMPGAKYTYGDYRVKSIRYNLTEK